MEIEAVNETEMKSMTFASFYTIFFSHVPSANNGF